MARAGGRGNGSGSDSDESYYSEDESEDERASSGLGAKNIGIFQIPSCHSDCLSSNQSLTFRGCVDLNLFFRVCSSAFSQCLFFKSVPSVHLCPIRTVDPFNRTPTIGGSSASCGNGRGSLSASRRTGFKAPFACRLPHFCAIPFRKHFSNIIDLDFHARS